LDTPTRVARVAPQGVVVAVRGRHDDEGLAAIDRFPALVVEDPDGVGVEGVGEDVHVVERTPAQVRLAVDLLPCLAPVLGAIDATGILPTLILLTLACGVRGFDNCPPASRLRWGSRQPNLAPQPFGQALVVRDLGPRSRRAASRAAPDPRVFP